MSVEHLVTGSVNMTTDMALADATNFDFSQVMVIGMQDGELVVRSSKMTRADAVYMLMDAIDHARGIGEEDE